ncbi:hypothetical protein [Endozoicomonas acroporae]|uniref:hypothetical protein n=1 Tax=Endozoicomonas acroporae TaxID=1701104 RepID=UPI000C78868B|nr:hypothetical protein [Endozoicomonas acroporae]
MLDLIFRRRNWYKAFGEKEYFYECIDPVVGKLLVQKEVPGEYKGWEVGTVSPHLKTLDNGILYFKADNRVIGRFNINSQCVEHAQVLEELTSQRFSEPQIYGNRMLVTDDNNCFHVYEWVE